MATTTLSNIPDGSGTESSLSGDVQSKNNSFAYTNGAVGNGKEGKNVALDADQTTSDSNNKVSQDEGFTGKKNLPVHNHLNCKCSP